jgi:hypothetical protein
MSLLLCRDRSQRTQLHRSAELELDCLERPQMKRRTRQVALGLLLSPMVLLGLYALSWRFLANTDQLYSFAAHDAATARLGYVDQRQLVIIRGFSGAAGAQQARTELSQALVRAGKEVRDLPETDSVTLDEVALNELAFSNNATVVSSTVVQRHPLVTVVRVRWTNGARAEIHDFGFWWGGISWFRRPSKDESLVQVATS